METLTNKTADTINSKSYYVTVNGIRMYYEIHGEGGIPLVLLHGGGSTIESSFGRILPLLARNQRVIAAELQNHGRSGMRNEAETFEQDAEDVAALLQQLEIRKAAIFGFSNGGTTALHIAIRYPHLVHKLVLLAAAYKREGFIKGFFEGMQQVTIDQMPEALKTAFRMHNPDPAALQHMFEKDRQRMVDFKDMDEALIRSITAPALIVNGDADVITAEHSLGLSRLLPDARLAILPGIHGSYIGEVTTITDDKWEQQYLTTLYEQFLAE